MSTQKNEEEVKIQRVMPFLLSLGLTREELKFERSFELVIGTNRVKVNSKKRTDAVGGRLDTLVTVESSWHGVMTAAATTRATSRLRSRLLSTKLSNRRSPVQRNPSSRASS